MEFKIITNYDQRALTALARALRKTVRKKRSRRSHILGVAVMAAVLLLTFPVKELDGRTVITWLAGLAILLSLIFEDRLNGYIARKRMLPGIRQAITVFCEDDFTTTTEIGETKWHYDTIAQIVELPEYFAFLFSDHHGQVYDKKNITGGEATEFAAFLEHTSGKKILQIQ